MVLVWRETLQKVALFQYEVQQKLHDTVSDGWTGIILYR